MKLMMKTYMVTWTNQPYINRYTPLPPEHLSIIPQFLGFVHSLFAKKCKKICVQSTTYGL